MSDKIKWKPDRLSNTSLYMQIVDYVKGQVAGGQWKPGFRIPSQRKLVEILGVNRSTVGIAIDELVSQGILKTETGSGTFVEDDTFNPLAGPVSVKDMYRYHGLFSDHFNSVQAAGELTGITEYIDLGSYYMSEELAPKSYIEKTLEYVASELDRPNHLPPLGHLGLRKEIVRKLADKGIRANPENILITSGTIHSLHLISLALIKINTDIYSEETGYINPFNVFPAMNINLRNLPMDEGGISVNKLARSVQKNVNPALLYMTPDYQTPASITMSHARQQKLLKLCTQNKIIIIEDDTFSDLWFDKKPPVPLKALDINGIVLYLGTVSQTLSASLRIGWIVGPKLVIKQLSNIMTQIDYGESSLSQVILKDLLETGAYGRYMDKLRLQLKARRDFMLSLLEIHLKELCTWIIPNGGHYILLWFNEGLPVDKLYDLAMQEKVVLDLNPIISNQKVTAISLSYSYVDYKEMVIAIRRLKKIVVELINPK